jgi:hypothetical protein
MPEIDDALARPTPGEKTLGARMAANARWAKEPDRAAATAAARAAQQHKREDEVDPEHKLSPQERAKRAENLHRAQLQRMALQRQAIAPYPVASCQDAREV